MITFGYKNKVSGPLRALIALAAGVMMVVMPGTALTLVVKIFAAFMLASGIVSLFVGVRDRKGGFLPLMTTNAVVDIIIAVLLFLYPEFVANFIIYLIGFALLIFGLFQLFALFSASRVMRLGFGVFVLPILVTLLGGYLLFNASAEFIVVVAGVAIIIYAVSELLSSWKMKKAIDEYEIHQAPQQPETEKENPLDDAKEVDYEKVDEQ